MSVSSRMLLTVAFAMALVVACAPSEAQDAGQKVDSPAAQASRLVLRWTIIVSDRFERSRAFKSDATDELIDQFMSGGAVRAVEDKASEEQIKKADAVVDRFTVAMIKAGTRRDDGSTEVTEAAMVAGHNTVCPAYPFC